MQHSSRGRSHESGSTPGPQRRPDALVKTNGQIWWEHTNCVNPPPTTRSPKLLPKQPVPTADTREQSTTPNRIQRIPTAPNCTTLTST
jgi:hypothetical protein